jgi:Transposase
LFKAQPNIGDDEWVSEALEGVVSPEPERWIRRTAEEKLRIVEAALRHGASIARVAREHGVNANQVFEWRYEFRAGTDVSASVERRHELRLCIMGCSYWQLLHRSAIHTRQS